MSATFAAAPTNSSRSAVARVRRSIRINARTRTPAPKTIRLIGAPPRRSSGNRPRGTSSVVVAPSRITPNATSSPSCPAAAAAGARSPTTPRRPSGRRPWRRPDRRPGTGCRSPPRRPRRSRSTGPGLGGDDGELRRAEQAKQQDRRREPERGAARHDGGEPAGIPEGDPHVPSSSLPGDNGPSIEPQFATSRNGVGANGPDWPQRAAAQQTVRRQMPSGWRDRTDDGIQAHDGRGVDRDPTDDRGVQRPAAALAAATIR